MSEPSQAIDTVDPAVETSGPVPSLQLRIAASDADGEDVAPERPSNPTRSIFHISSAIVSLLFTLVVFDSRELLLVAGGIALSFWCLEVLRRPSPRFNTLLMRFFAPIAHPGERHRINSATWYMTALTFLALTHSQILCAVGVAVLGFADPAASAIGRRFGRVELLRRRTLEGSLAFVVVGTIAAAAALAFATPRLPTGFLLATAFVAGVAGSIAELLSRRLDDNLTIPLVSSAAAAALLGLGGHALWG